MRARRPLGVAFLLLLSLGASAEPAGKAVFEQRCALCHQADGAGAVGVAPSLVGTLTRYLESDRGRTYLGQILISGMVGKIRSGDQEFNGLMPSFADDLDDATIAATIDYVLATYNGVALATDTSPITPTAVAGARAAGPSGAETRALRNAILAATP